MKSSREGVRTLPFLPLAQEEENKNGGCWQRELTCTHALCARHGSVLGKLQERLHFRKLLEIAL